MENVAPVAGWLFAAVLAILILWDVQRSIFRLISARTAGLACAGIWYCLEAVQNPREVRDFGPSLYDTGILILTVSTSTFLIGYHFTAWPLFRSFARSLHVLSRPAVVTSLMYSGLCIGIGAILIYTSFDFSVLVQGLTGTQKRWSGLSRGRYGSWMTIIFELQMFLQATVPLAVALLFTKRASSTSRVVAFLFYLWMLLRTLSSGARSPLAPLLLCPVAAVFWNSSERWRRRLLWIGTPCALIVGYVLAAVIVEGRNDGRLDIEAGLSVEYTGFEMFRELLLIVKKSDEGSLKHTLGMTYFAQLVNPVPRALWPGKPVADAGLILARAVGAVDHITGEPTMTVSPGFLGEAYMNFGWFGIVLLPFLGGAIAKAWDDLLPDAAQSLPIFLVYCAGLAAILNSGRSFNLSTFYGLCALYVLVHVFGYFSSQSAIPHPHTRHVATRGGPVREM